MNGIDPMEVFTSSSREDKMDVLARLAHELTVLARDTYDLESDGVVTPSRLRIINEVQHRIMGFLIALMTKNPNRYPDDIFMQIILDHPEDLELQNQIYRTLDRILSQVVPA
jgi:hypothetical protein